MIRYNYNRQLTPTAPFVHVIVGRPVDEAAVPDIPAQLDTAADMTVIPWKLVEALELVPLEEIPILGFGGHVTSVPTFLIQVAIRRLDPILLKVLANRDEPHVLLGRDLLNRYRPVLDGPGMTLEVG